MMRKNTLHLFQRYLSVGQSGPDKKQKDKQNCWIRTNSEATGTLHRLYVYTFYEM